MTNQTQAPHQAVATEILRQLGGGKFRAMTGAKDFGASSSDKNKGALTFKLPSRFARDGINYVEISLDFSDTYTVTFSKFTSRGIKAIIAGKAPFEIKTISTHSDVYCDSLRSLFTRATGLDTSL